MSFQYIFRAQLVTRQRPLKQWVTRGDKNDKTTGNSCIKHGKYKLILPYTITGQSILSPDTFVN